jgi:hypothetical protein
VVASLLIALPPVAAVALHKPILRAAGGALVAQDALEPADIIVVAADTGPAGVLEAADLVHSGVAPRVAVFTDPPDPVDREFLRRGIPYEDAAARSIRQLRALGVHSIELIPRAVAGSEDEGLVLPEWCRQNRFRLVVVVSTSDHSRRLRRVLRRSMAGQATRVAVRPTRYSKFDPERWWETRDGIRTQVIETQKLLLDVARHPVP